MKPSPTTARAHPFHRLHRLYGCALCTFAPFVTSALGACDPVHTDDIAALGGETRGVPKGPLHRPGQPCTLCHDGALRDPPAFSVAGTIFQTPGAQVGASGIVVAMTDSAGTLYQAAATNSAGNFYVTPRQWTPTYPIVQTVLVENGATVATMYSQISWSGSCAWCHSDPPSDSSPGHVSVTLDDGGTPP
jgi:hypothetical protein